MCQCCSCCQTKNKQRPQCCRCCTTHQGLLRVFFSGLLLILSISSVLYFFKDQVKQVLFWLEFIPGWQRLLVFGLLFTAVSFPFFWGYLLLNLTCGYLYGFAVGLPCVSFCAVCGVGMAHTLMRLFCKSVIVKQLEGQSDYLTAILNMISNQQGHKVALLARLTPIPFGFQNALFAATDIPLRQLLPWSAVGMLPAQMLNIYIGSTLRSMEDVVSGKTATPTAYGFFVFQILATIGLLMFVTRKAREELRKAMAEQLTGDFLV